MSDLIIYINDEALDLSESQVIAITKQAAKVGDFARVLADGTNQIPVLMTARNKATLDNAQLVQTESSLPYSRLSAKMVQEGIETIQDGFAIIENATTEKVNLQVIGGNAGFFNLIKDLKLVDLDLSAYAHYWSNANVFANRNNTSGFLYALYEQSIDEASETLSTYGANLYAVQTQKLMPSFFAKSLVDKIFSEQGFSFQSDILSLNIYDNLIFNSGQFIHSADWVELKSFRANISTFTKAFVFSPFIAAAGLDNDTTDGFFDNDGQVTLGAWHAVTPVAKFENNDLMNYKIYCQIEFTIDTFDAFGSSQIDITIENTDAAWQLTGISSTGTYNVTIEAEVTDAAVSTDYWVRFQTNAVGYTILNGVFWNEPFNKIVAGSYITADTFVPDMTQADFLKEVARIFQLVYNVDNVSAIVTAERFDKVKENIPNAVDYSDKYAEESELIDFHIDGFAQTNYLKYKEDDITNYDAEGSISVGDFTLAQEKTFVQMSMFAATSTKIRFDNKNAPFIPVFDVDGYSTTKYKPRFLIARPETFLYNINFNRDGVDLPTFDVTFAYFTEAGNTDSLDFPTLIDRFFQTVIDMTTNAKTIVCKVNLKIADVYSYNPFIPVYIQKFNSYFYLEKIENYLKGKLTKIKLIKL